MKYLAHVSEDGEREQTVLEHSRNVAELAGKFAGRFQAESWGYCCGMVHDTGKYSREFQQRLKGGPPVDHSTAGAKELYGKRDFMRWRHTVQQGTMPVCPMVRKKRTEKERQV